MRRAPAVSVAGGLQGAARLQHIPEAPLCFPSLPLTGLAPAAGRAPHGQWQL